LPSSEEYIIAPPRVNAIIVIILCYLSQFATTVISAGKPSLQRRSSLLRTPTNYNIQLMSINSIDFELPRMCVNKKEPLFLRRQRHLFESFPVIKWLTKRYAICSAILLFCTSKRNPLPRHLIVGWKCSC